MRRLPTGIRKVTKEEFIQSFLEWEEQDDIMKTPENIREFSRWNEKEKEVEYRPNSRW